GVPAAGAVVLASRAASRAPRPGPADCGNLAHHQRVPPPCPRPVARVSGGPPMPVFRVRAAAASLMRVVSLAALLSAVAGCVAAGDVERWGMFEAAFASTAPFENALQDRDLFVTFTAPSGQAQTVR